MTSGDSEAGGRRRLRRYPGYVRFWGASTLSDFGSAITSLALSVLVGTDLGRGLLLNDAANQSFLTSSVPRTLLTRANARLDQSSAVAQTTGPALAGLLIRWLSAPVAILVDAVTYLVGAAIMASLPDLETSLG